MFNSHAPQTYYKPRGPVFISGLLSGMLSAGFLYWLLFEAFPPTGWYQDLPFVASSDWLWDLIVGNLPRAHGKDQMIWLFLHWREAFTGFFEPIFTYDLQGELSWRLATLIVGTLIAAAGAALYRRKHLEPINDLTHLRGHQLFKGTQAIRNAFKATKDSLKRSGRGINIAPKLPISLDTETKHLLLVGASGSGKTQFLLFLIAQLFKRQDRMIIHDTKGDFTATLPSDDFILLAPHHAHSWAWDIAKDCLGLAAARELAAQFIPSTKEPMWVNGAREAMTGLIRWLQQNYGEAWTWADLQHLVFSEPVEIQAMLLKAHPEGAVYVKVDPESGIIDKTSYSFLVTFWSHVGQVVSPLAAAWSDTPEEKRISLTQWLANDETDRPVLILQRSAEFSTLSKAWIGAAVQLMANFASSPSLPESRTRRIWLLLDEFAQMGKLEGFQQFLEVGRSRGIRCVLGLQDLEQLSQLYGQEMLKTWLNTIGTKIVYRMNAGPSASFIAKDLIGEHEVSWEEESLTHPKTGLFADKENMPSTSRQMRTAMVPILMPSELESELGPQTIEGEIRIRALVLGLGDIYQLDWPLTIWPEQRPATVPAKWLKD